MTRNIPRDHAKDRHSNLGDGFLGAEAACELVVDGRLASVPLILETPNG